MPNSDDQKTYALFQTPNNKKLIADLMTKSVNLFLFPPLETEKAKLNEKGIAFVKDITEFDWLIFTDVYAVDYFLEILSANDIDFFELDAVRVCAFGETVADRLRFSQVHADVIPRDLNAETVFSAISFYEGAENLKNLKMLLIKESSAQFQLADLLKETEVNLAVLPIYRAKTTTNNELTKLKTLLKGGAIDEYIFSAPEDLIALFHYFPSENELTDIFDEVKAVAIDVNIFQNLRENNLKPHNFIRQ